MDTRLLQYIFYILYTTDGKFQSQNDSWLDSVRIVRNVRTKLRMIQYEETLRVSLVLITITVHPTEYYYITIPRTRCQLWHYGWHQYIFIWIISILVLIYTCTNLSGTKPTVKCTGKLYSTYLYMKCCVETKFWEKSKIHFSLKSSHNPEPGQKVNTNVTKFNYN